MPSVLRTFSKTFPALMSTVCHRSLNPAWLVIVVVTASYLFK